MAAVASAAAGCGLRAAGVAVVAAVHTCASRMPGACVTTACSACVALRSTTASGLVGSSTSGSEIVCCR